MTLRPTQTGFEPRTADPERRDFFDLRRRLAIVEGLATGAPWNFMGTIPTPGPPTTAQDPLPHDDGDFWIDSAGNGWVWNGSAWINVGSVKGPAGPPGPVGPPGPPGSVGTIAFTYNQSTPAAVWTVTHNLGFYPNVTVVDSSGATVEGDITHVNVTQLTLTFSGGFSGLAYLS